MKKILTIVLLFALFTSAVSAADIVNPENHHKVLYEIVDGKIVNPENPHHVLYEIKKIHDEDNPRVIAVIVDPENPHKVLYEVKDNGSYISIVNPETSHKDAFVIVDGSVINPENPHHVIYQIMG